jgi:hypothetical protein
MKSAKQTLVVATVSCGGDDDDVEYAFVITI